MHSFDPTPHSPIRYRPRSLWLLILLCTIVKVAQLDFSRWHPPNFEWLILRRTSSDELATSSIYYAFVKFSKTVGLTDIGVTIATQRWRHAFYIRPVLSKSRPKLLKWSHVPRRLHIGLFDCEVLKILFERFWKQFGRIFAMKKRKIRLSFYW